jgi:DNA-binding NarL/FixJ family response regulator
MSHSESENLRGKTLLAGTRSTEPRPLRVLVVDDHLLVRCTTRRQLQDLPGLHVVGEATDGLEAVAMARTLVPDLIIMDICMPSLDGIEATRRIKADFPDIQIIVLSSHEGNPFHQQALEAGANGYVVKGRPSEQLTEAVLPLIATRRPGQ